MYYNIYVMLGITARKERLWRHVIPGLHYELFLTKGGVGRKKAIHKAKEQLLVTDQSHQQVQVYKSGGMNGNPVARRVLYIKQVKLVPALVFSAYTKTAKLCNSNLILACITIAKIDKSLEKLNILREKPRLASILNIVPTQLYDFKDLFLDHNSEGLPPHRPGHDISISLKLDENKSEKLLSYGPLFEMT